MPAKDTTSINVNGNEPEAFSAGYEPPVLVKQGSLRDLTLEAVPVSGGGGSPWCGI